MKTRLISVGTRMPSWVAEGCADYQRRLGREWGFELVEVPLAKRGKSIAVEQCLEQEGAALLAHCDAHDYRVALCVDGEPLSTESLARKLDDLRQESRNLCLLVGGPDGLSDSCLGQVHSRWSLGRITLPHPLVRVVLIEQIYRAACILQGHPYHRA